MLSLATPYYQRKYFLRRRRPISLWRLVRRYQLMELTGITGAIIAIWLGIQLDNGRLQGKTLQPAGMTSASADVLAEGRAGLNKPL